MSLIKKISCFIFMSFLAMSLAFSKGSMEHSGEENGKLKVVTTIFPEYDWVKSIAQDKVDLTLLLKGSSDMHSWQPTSADIIKISTSDVFIYVGGESDSWVKDVIANSVNKNQVAINLMEVLKDFIYEEELIEGMQTEDEDENEESEESEKDEHIWLSLNNAKFACNEICKVLSSLDKENEVFFRENCKKYSKKLEELDEDYKSLVKNAKRNVILVADRFPFRYLVEDYDIEYFAAFVGCSAETEASFKTISFLVSKVDEFNLPYILCIDGSDKKIANTIVANTKSKNQDILLLNSLQSMTNAQISSGANYLSIMSENLKILEKALY